MRDYLKVNEDQNDQFNAWRVQHNKAVRSPLPGWESALIGMLGGIEEYRKTYIERFDSKVEDDYILGDDGIAQIVKGVRVLLNGEHGRLDAGTIDAYLVKFLEAAGVEI